MPSMTVREYLRRHEQALPVEETRAAPIDVTELTSFELSLMYRALNSERNLIIDHNLPVNQLLVVNSLMRAIDEEFERQANSNV